MQMENLNHKSLKDGCNVKKKIFVDFMDDYILLSYFGFIIVVLIFIIIIFCKKSFAFKKCAKRIIILFIFVVDFTHYIAYIIKLAFSIKLIKKELFPTKCAFINLTCSFWEKEKEEKKSNIIWFYTFDIVIIIVLSLYILLYFLLLMSIGCVSDERNLHSGDLIEDDIITTHFINQFNGINIYDVQLPEGFDNLSDKKKNETIFKKENISKYKYIKNEKRIKLILNIMNDIRRNIYIPLLKHERGEYIPDFILNEKTKMYFYTNENIYQLSPDFYIFKYLKDEFQNHINDKEIKTIISNELLDRISIIEKNELEYISIYKNNPNNNQGNNNDIINNRTIIERPRIHLNVDNVNTEDRINDKSESSSVI